jgi:putative aminopeptidase FrvX
MIQPTLIDTDYLLRFLRDLLETPSPSGMTEAAIALTERELQELGQSPVRTLKGGLAASLQGREESLPRALAAHVDTLGAMVKEIKPNGRLRLTKIGGFSWNTVEGEGCTVYSASGRTIRGSLLVVKASSHIYGTQVGDLKREDENMEVRLDERTFSPQETRELGIEVGDFVAIDPRVEIASNGFVRSRHLDDKACVACMLAAAKAIRDGGLVPSRRTTFYVSNFEEVGHGASSGLPSDLAELVILDMQAVGEGQASTEFQTAICAKDAGGPYHGELTRHLRRLAEAASIPFKVDTFLHYRSDRDSYWRSGGAARVALFGPGIDASHNYERTHLDSLVATCWLILEYVLS